MKIAGLTYVDDFTFSKEQGFTGSAGSHTVKGYMRGGHVRKAEGGKSTERHVSTKTTKRGAAKADTKRKASGKGMPRNVKAHGGEVEYAHGGSMHDKLRHEGEKMGYKYGGAVKDTSSEFVEKSGAMASMDNGVYPAQSNSQADKEAGGRKRLKPKFNYGGKVHTVRDVKASHGGRMKKGKGYKQRGGLAAYNEGGYAKPSDLGTGMAARAAESEQKRVKRTRSAVAEAVAASHAAMGVKDKPPESQAYDPDYKISHEHAVGGAVTANKGGYAEGGKWIQGAIKHPGALRKSMGVKKGQKIPAKKLAAAAKKSGVTGKRARLAETLKKMN